MAKGSAKCYVCGKTVYPMEMIKADDKVFHKTGCLKVIKSIELIMNFLFGLLLLWGSFLVFSFSLFTNLVQTSSDN